MHPMRFNCGNALQALEDSGIACPRLDSYADRLRDYWKRLLDPDLLLDQMLRERVTGKAALVTGGVPGIGRFQDCLERGFSAFQVMSAPQDFVLTIVERERRIVERPYGGENAPFAQS